MIMDAILRDQNCYDLDEDKIEYIRAKDLLVSNRIDLVAKYKFVEAYDKGKKIPFIEKMYYAHLEAFSSGRFVEPGKEDTKKSFEDYLTIFRQLIENIKGNGVKKEISVIPVGKNNVILNGSHRTAIAMYYDMTVPIVRYEDLEVTYDYRFFQEKLLDHQYLNYMITEYIRIKENVFFACIWPRADQSKWTAVDRLIKEKCDIVYRTSVVLTYNGLKNLMIQIYEKQEWCGNLQNGYRGVTGKADACYAESEKTIIYILDNARLPEIIDLKKNVRNIYQMANHSIHISDNSQESLKMAHLLLNANSVDALNYGQMFKYKRYIAIIKRLSKELVAYRLDSEAFLIDSSGVLGVYGIRYPNDIDCLTFHHLQDYHFSEKVTEHDEYISYYSSTKEELIYNPNYYLYAYEIKFCTLKVLLKMKKLRNEKKDCEDCKLIRPYIEKQITYKTKIIQCKMKWVRKCRNAYAKIQMKLFTILKIFHLYDLVRKYYRLLKRKPL